MSTKRKGSDLPLEEPNAKVTELVCINFHELPDDCLNIIFDLLPPLHLKLCISKICKRFFGLARSLSTRVVVPETHTAAQIAQYFNSFPNATSVKFLGALTEIDFLPSLMTNITELDLFGCRAAETENLSSLFTPSLRVLKLYNLLPPLVRKFRLRGRDAGLERVSAEDAIESLLKPCAATLQELHLICRERENVYVEKPLSLHFPSLLSLHLVYTSVFLRAPALQVMSAVGRRARLDSRLHPQLRVIHMDNLDPSSPLPSSVTHVYTSLFQARGLLRTVKGLTAIGCYQPDMILPSVPPIVTGEPQHQCLRQLFISHPDLDPTQCEGLTDLKVVYTLRDDISHEKLRWTELFTLESLSVQLVWNHPTSFEKCEPFYASMVNSFQILTNLRRLEMLPFATGFSSIAVPRINSHTVMYYALLRNCPHLEHLRMMFAPKNYVGLANSNCEFGALRSLKFHFNVVPDMDCVVALMNMSPKLEKVTITSMGRGLYPMQCSELLVKLIERGTPLLKQNLMSLSVPFPAGAAFQWNFLDDFPHTLLSCSPLAGLDPYTRRENLETYCGPIDTQSADLIARRVTCRRRYDDETPLRSCEQSLALRAQYPADRDLYLLGLEEFSRPFTLHEVGPEPRELGTWHTTAVHSLTYYRLMEPQDVGADRHIILLNRTAKVYMSTQAARDRLDFGNRYISQFDPASYPHEIYISGPRDFPAPANTLVLVQRLDSTGKAYQSFDRTPLRPQEYTEKC